MIEIFQNKSKTFQKSNQLLHLVHHHCSVIVKDQFGAVGTMKMVDWDWETQGTETKQKRFKDFLQSNQWQEECIGQCLWTSKAMFGFVDRIAMENWGWATQHKSIRLRKTTIFLELLLLQEGILIFQCFWTNKEMFSLVGTISMGSWDWETRMSDTHRRKSTTSLQCLHFLLATQLVDICRLWIVKEECGAVDAITMGNWEWATQMTHSPSSRLQAFQN